jgi:hypothetical protein
MTLVIDSSRPTYPEEHDYAILWPLERTACLNWKINTDSVNYVGYFIIQSELQYTRHRILQECTHSQYGDDSYRKAA